MPTRAVALIGFWQDVPDSFSGAELKRVLGEGKKAVVSSERSSCTRVRNRPDPGNQVPPGPLLNSKAVWVRLYTTVYTGWQITPWIYDWIGRFNNDFWGNALDLSHINCISSSNMKKIIIERTLHCISCEILIIDA
jgi:hypothetical protein